MCSRCEAAPTAAGSLPPISTTAVFLKRAEPRSVGEEDGPSNTDIGISSRTIAINTNGQYFAADADQELERERRGLFEELLDPLTLHRFMCVSAHASAGDLMKSSFTNLVMGLGLVAIGIAIGVILQSRSVSCKGYWGPFGREFRTLNAVLGPDPSMARGYSTIYKRCLSTSRVCKASTKQGHPLIWGTLEDDRFL